MKKKAILLLIGILIGVLAIIQIIIIDNKELDQATATSTEVESIQQNSIMLKTAVFYVLSFIKH